MIRDLKSRIQEAIKDYKKPETVEHTATELKAFEILNKPAVPKKQLTLSEKKLNRAIAILTRK